jgi:AcrR family transcriptional regulator
MQKKEQGTECKIKKAACKVFLEKGFAATKNRDITEFADIN